MRFISSWFQAAVQPRQWNVAGIDCDALSVWHFYALSDSGNPYICGGNRTHDAAMEVLIYCTGGIEHSRQILAHPRAMQKTTRRIFRRIRRIGFARLDAAVAEYVMTGMRVPGHKRRVSRPGDSTQVKYMAAPRCWALVESMLSSGAAHDIDAAWNMPYSTAQCLFDTRRDASGEDDSLETLDEERRFDAMIASKAESEVA